MFKVKRNVTLPTLSLNVGDVKFVRFDEAMYVGKIVKVKEGEKAKEPPTLVNVTNMETGEQATLVVNAVLKSTIEEAYPGASYIGKTFRVEKMEKKAGKAYHGFKIQEVEVEAEAVAPGAVASTSSPTDSAPSTSPSSAASSSSTASSSFTDEKHGVHGGKGATKRR